MTKTTNPVVFLVAAGGASLLFAAVRNVSPIELLRSTIGATDDDPSPIVEPLGPGDTLPTTDEPGGTFQPFPVASSSGDTFPIDPDNLVSIGQGGHKLAAPAAAAFAQWERAYGSTIYVSDSYRSFSQQAAAHAREPNRFADPSGSLHPRGIAVDVDLTRTTGGQSVTGQTKYDRLVQTGRLVAFRNYSGGKPGTDSWHFSFMEVG